MADLSETVVSDWSATQTDIIVISTESSEPIVGSGYQGPPGPSGIQGETGIGVVISEVEPGPPEDEGLWVDLGDDSSFSGNYVPTPVGQPDGRFLMTLNGVLVYANQTQYLDGGDANTDHGGDPVFLDGGGA